jgi:predicted DNA-binding transcriptional regulator AlpA
MPQYPTPTVRLLRKRDVAEALGVSVWTLDRWCRARTFPQPIFATDASPAMWRLRDVEGWIDQRRRSRRRKPQRGGQLKRGRSLGRASGGAP